MLDLIRSLTEAWGPSGYEHQVREIIQTEISDVADDILVDGLGNLVARVGTGGTRILLAAHMDEIGVMCYFVEPNTGYLRFDAIGGVLPSSLHGNRVRFEDGTIGVVAIHDPYGKGRTSTPNYNQFYIDVNNGEDDTPQSLVGTPAGFARGMDVRGYRIIAKSLDDRIGCAIMIEAMRRLHGNTPHELYFGFTVQEEVGRRGIIPLANRIHPDLGMAVDVTAAAEDMIANKTAVRLGGGPAIKMSDTKHIVPPFIRNWMIDTAEANDIPYQREVLTLAASTDASHLQLAHHGVPSGVLSIPCHLVHTASETVDIRDVEQSVDLLVALLSNPIPS